MVASQVAGCSGPLYRRMASSKRIWGGQEEGHSSDPGVSEWVGGWAGLGVLRLVEETTKV